MMIVLTTEQPAFACKQVMNGCVIRAMDAYFSFGPTDCLWIVPGTFDLFA